MARMADSERVIWELNQTILRLQTEKDRLTALFELEDHEWFKERCELYSRAEAAEAKLREVEAERNALRDQVVEWEDRHFGYLQACQRKHQEEQDEVDRLRGLLRFTEEEYRRDVNDYHDKWVAAQTRLETADRVAVHYLHERDDLLARLAAVEAECYRLRNLTPGHPVAYAAMLDVTTTVLAKVRGEGDRPAHVIAPNGWCSTCGAYTCGEGDRG